MDPDTGIPQDDFKWFGEGFDGFPKRLPDNCVEYAIHIITATPQTEAQTRERLRSVETAAKVLTKKYLKEYIWQRDSFDLELVRKDGVWLLQGRAIYGDCVADEWLVVYLLMELSKQFPDAWIRVYDEAGEFLLIEAANALPKWLNPEVAENRVWLNNSRLLIIPLSKAEKAARKAGSDGGALTIEEARTFIKTQSTSLIHDPKIDKEAFYRLRNYPAEISENLHHKLVTIPRKLAAIMHTKPAYISAAVEAFYLRDPISLRPLKTDDASTLKFPPKDLVTTSVRFSKTLYAQLEGQQFDPPKAWADVLKENIHPDTFGKLEMGMRVACGFEMLVADPQNRDKKAVREIKLLLEDIESGDEPLPTDAEVEAWGLREDDESWLNINFADLESELAGRRDKGPSTFVDGGGFGDKAAQENLRKMVQNFDAFLKDDEAGAEGAEVDEMDFDNDEKRWLDDDEDDDGDSDDEDEDGDGGKAEDHAALEKEFTNLMREMMGMPPENPKKEPPASSATTTVAAGPAPPPKVQELHSDDDEPYDPNEMAEMKKVMAQMEAELREAGALDLDPAPKPASASKKNRSVKGKGKVTASGHQHNDDNNESADEDMLDDDYNLAKNMLEAFKGQAGAAGPAGNLLGMMGMKFPRDEGEGRGEGRGEGKKR
ncbi:SGT1-domain-containing protein [Saccharata proteae CBS 121410]|uniref:SGT1-domain-containing protein n=1 Tax=Saccharata proteae CBS 121410 TaxID=1314787 RepID=A0A9P4HT04_9PEZI|nr:SGT1-domain-containing protein [Saccharata proteae CBS 121410]